jgi:hypothetical protein
MANRKPTPPTQASIAQGFISPYELANLGKPPFEEKPNRGEQISLKDSEPYDDATQDFTIGLQDVDEALLKHINDTIKPSVVQNGNRIEVPTIYGSPERWKSMQADGYYRDKNGKLMYPLIVVKRDNVIKDRTLGRKLDGNRVRLYKEFENQYTPRNRYDDISKIENRMPVREYSIVAIPDYVNISYSGVIYTNFVDQMNNLVEAFNFASDSYWGDKERFMFRTRIDSFGTFTEANQGEDRAIRAEFTMTVYGYLIPDTINKDLATLKKTYSKAQIRLEGEKSFDYFNLNNAINVIQQLPPSTTCANSTVQLNGTTIGTIASGETGDFPVTQNGSPVGSWNGSAWIVQPCATPSIAISYSNNSPTYGDTITITATPSAGYVPTSYLFFVFDGNELTFLAEQVSNVYSWTTNVIGALELYVVATDGVIEVADVIDITVNSNPAFISEWVTDYVKDGSFYSVSAANQIQLPLISSGNYNFVVDWGDGNTDTITVWNQAETRHTYAVEGKYTVTIIGTIEGWQFGSDNAQSVGPASDRAKIVNILNWGTLTITTIAAFYNCIRLDSSAVDAPTINTTSLQNTFRNCTVFNGYVGNWDVSGVQAFGGFGAGQRFGMFADATLFNNGGVNDMDNWDASSLNDIIGMFRNCVGFNQDLPSWDVSNCTSFASVFENCTAFNGDVSTWNVSNATTVGSMFASCPSFNQDISGWNVSGIQSFNTFLSNNTAFDQDLSSWVLSSATDCRNMFINGKSVNFNVSGWDMGNVTLLGGGGNGGMFDTCRYFDQDLSAWKIENVTLAQFFLRNSTLSTPNYDATLIGWEARLQSLYPSGVGYPNSPNFNMGLSKFTIGSAADAAKTSLTTTFGWTIADGGGI